MTDEDSLRRALERSRRHWNVDAVHEAVSERADIKRTAQRCMQCDAPCTEDELCATAAADHLGLFEQVGQDHALHLIESGIERLALQNKATVRDEDEKRPSTFVSLD